MVYLNDSVIVSSFLFCSFMTWHCCRDFLRQRQALESKSLSWKRSVTLVLRNVESWYLPLLRLNCLTFIPCSSFPGNGVSLGLISVFSHTSDIIFAVRYRKSLLYVYKVTFLATHTVLNIKGKDKILVDCMLSQLYRSLINSQNCWLDHSNPNFIIGRAVN